MAAIDTSHLPTFRLQVVDKQGKVVISPFAAGGKLEIDLIEEILRGISREGYVFMRTDAAVRRGIAAAIKKLKDDTRYVAHNYR